MVNLCLEEKENVENSLAYLDHDQVLKLSQIHAEITRQEY